MNPLEELVIAPGLFTIQTDRGAGGRWKGGDKVRFRHGRPRKLGGWQKSSANTFLGICRKLFDWQSLALEKFIAFGTHLKLYVWKAGTFYDITPIEESGTLGNNPFTTASGLTTVTVHDVAHTRVAGDYVHFSGASTFNGVTIAGEYSVTSVTGVDDYVITHSVAASGTGAGGGAAVAYQYELTIGAVNSILGFGYGAGAWGGSTYGTARTVSNFLTVARLWSLDHWGEDLIACPRDGAIYLWDTSVGTGTRAAAIAGTPATAKSILVSPENQHLVVLGADGDPLLIKWSSSEDYSAFTASSTNSAGQKRLTTGNEILCGIKARKQILVFTDSNVWSMTFSGVPFNFDFDNLGKHGGLRGPNAAVEVDGIVYWMAENDFYFYDGAMHVLPCDVHPTVFEDLNTVQRIKTYAGYNHKFGEVWWYYCSEDATEVDRYVIYNIAEKTWAFGTMARTAYIGDSEIFTIPFAAGTNGLLYDHETGVDDDGGAMAASLESGDVEIGKGARLMFVDRIVPDFKVLTGSVSLVVSGKKYPQSTEITTKPALTFLPSTEFKNPRIKARQLSLSFSSSGIGDDWRLGTLRVGAKAVGRK